jgi:hypothetical protein
MAIAFALTLAYFAANLALMTWLEHERARGHRAPGTVGVLAWLLRYGPPLAGAVYLVVVSGDWQFLLLVLGFFAFGAWLLTGLLAYTNHGPDRPGLKRDDD